MEMLKVRAIREIRFSYTLLLLVRVDTVYD